MYSRLLAVAISALALTSDVTATKTPVSASLFKTLLRYTDFSSASYADTCSKPPHGSTVLKYISSASTGTQATVFKYPTTKEIILAFRGTSTPQDFDYDLFFTALPLNTTSTKCSSCKVHSGFQAAWNSVSASAISGVKSAKQSNAGYTLTITGHSLGGGIAAIAAASFAAAGNTVTVYTYGEPRNGNTAWTTYLQSLVPTSRYFRVTHANDGVPQIPPKELGFQHHGTEYWESKSSNNTAASTYKCDHTEPKDFGDSPINGAHITYSNIVIGNSLNIVACGATVP